MLQPLTPDQEREVEEKKLHTQAQSLDHVYAVSLDTDLTRPSRAFRVLDRLYGLCVEERDNPLDTRNIRPLPVLALYGANVASITLDAVDRLGEMQKLVADIPAILCLVEPSPAFAAILQHGRIYDRFAVFQSMTDVGKAYFVPAGK